MSDRLDAFVVCTPGLEPLVAGEIERLGIRQPRVRHGGVDAAVTVAQLWSMNLRLRCATRVLVRIGRFSADSFPVLQAGLRHVEWTKWLPPGAPVVLKVASSNSALFHTGAIAERALEIIPGATDAPSGEEGDGDADTPTQVLHIRVTRDVVLVSIDASGPPLYRRGWRLATAKAPMRETAAAALLAHSGWDRKAPLVDPFCGSGTVAIEAAIAARRMASGRMRSFAFERWPNFDEAGWARMRAGADADVVAGKAPIIAADRDAGAIAAAEQNAERAGVADSIEFRVASISDLSVPNRAGWIVTNPPYGHRIGGGSDLRDLYDRFGTVLRERAAGWHVELVNGGDDARPQGFVDRLGLEIADRLETTNGGLPVEFVNATVAR